MSDADNSKVSVIIVNYNGRYLLEECIESIFSQTYRNYEILVVDNGSDDDSVSFLQTKYKKKIRLLQNNTNLGFAEANNLGIRASSGDYVALLNNDAVADPEWLRELVHAAQHSGDYDGMWASKILFYDKKNVIDTAGHLIYPDGLNRGRGKGEFDLGQYDKKEEVIFPSGCAALYIKRMIDSVGGFDSDFFAYGDDADIGMKARLAGWKCMYVPTAVVYHKSSATAGQYSPLKAYLVERNRIWILIKYFPIHCIFLSIFYSLLRYSFQAYGALMKKGSPGRFAERFSKKELLKILFKAYYDAFSGISLMWKKRKKLVRHDTVTTRAFHSWLTRFGISAREISLRD